MDEDKEKTMNRKLGETDETKEREIGFVGVASEKKRKKEGGGERNRETDRRETQNEERIEIVNRERGKKKEIRERVSDEQPMD